MSLFNFFNKKDINKGVEDFHGTPGAVLLDVRTPDEYRQGHIEDSVNLPLDRISKAPGKIPEKTTPIFVYCLSGARSSQAASSLKSMGYTQVVNIGGINAWRGKIVTGSH